jgi:hypothetical protein
MFCQHYVLVYFVMLTTLSLVFFDQLDLLSKTMGIMEERLTLTESRVSSMIASQRTAAYQQQRAHIEHSDVADVAPAHAPATASAQATSGSASSATAAPSVSDLRTIQLRVMCRQYGLDATGTEAELLQRLNDSVATRAGIAAPGNATSFAAASDMNDSLENSVEQDETKGQSESEASYEAFDSEGETGEAGIDFYAEENFQVIVRCVCCSAAVVWRPPAFYAMCCPVEQLLCVWFWFLNRKSYLCCSTATTPSPRPSTPTPTAPSPTKSTTMPDPTTRPTRWWWKRKRRRASLSWWRRDTTARRWTTRSERVALQAFVR